MPTGAERHILLTGAGGRIGTAFFESSRDRYRFRLADRSIGSIDAREPHEIVQFDVADLAACRDACAGIDTVVHLAADASPEAGFYESLLDSNIRAVYNIYRAAADAGCRRVVFASSLHTIAGYPPETAVKADAPVRPVTIYGVSKCFGEAVANYFAYVEGLSSIAVRIGAYEAPWIADEPTAANLSAFISARDLNHLLVRCIEAPDIDFAIVHGISDNRIKRVDLAQTSTLLDYDPLDDGFAIYRGESG